MSSGKTRWVLVTGLGSLALGLLAAVPAAAEPVEIAVDIAEDGSRFSFDEEPVFDDGLPAYGNGFVTQGYIYPAGTVSCAAGACNGVLADGSPEFPDLVLGEWSCWGTHVGDGAHTTTGPWVVTTQQFSLGSTPGAESILTAGYELADLDLPALRAVVGGTGPYRNARGQQLQSLAGFNPSFGVVLRVELRVRP